ncbi:alpha/beta hydrolase family protein [Nocardioides ferulae]|uniref:alpha/beta hydrolase family protein n=1 Tax=Nocardioides ferulae TaxID=2340821 RepID=UPI0013DE65CC|nr:alpha/beta hydrolase [Nocardioides ferulae]
MDALSDQPPAPQRVSYGTHPSQYAELFLPAGGSRGVVVVVHGGFWKAAYDCSLGRPLAAALARAGWTAWNIEYRRVGDGGGTPETLDDVAAAIDKLAEVSVDGVPLDLSCVLTLGHSAGGHLAAWAAARGQHERWAQERVPVTGVVSQAGVLDLRRAHVEQLGAGAVEEFLGRRPTDLDVTVDPLLQLPLDVPLWCVHGVDDEVVPITQSRRYVEHARLAGAEVGIVEVEGDHFTVVDVDSDAWARTLEVLESLASTPTRH